MSTVLLVEDNQALRTIYKNQLTHDGYTVVEASTIKQAHELLQTSGPNILLLDIMLPDGSGLSFLEEIRKEDRYKNLPVLMLTSLPEEIAFNKSQNLGIHGYLQKDQVTPGQISERVKLALSENNTATPK